MNWFEGFIYGLVSGLTEIMPVSPQAHQHILLRLFGKQAGDPIVNLIVHLAILLAVYIGSRGILVRLRREQKARYRGKRHPADVRSSYDLRLIRTSVIPMMLCMLAWIFTRRWYNNSLMIGLFCVLNGFIIYLCERFPHGNKDSRYVSVLDAIILGIMGALAVLPGVSRIAATQAYATARGVDKQHSMNWALVLSIPALCILCVFDIVQIAGGTAAAVGFSAIAGYILAAIGAFIGAYLCVFFLRTLVNRMNTVAFAYYSWGVALLILVLFLIS